MVTQRNLSTISVLRVIPDVDEANRLFYAALHQTEQEAEKEFGPRTDFTIRDLVPSDMPGLTTEEWVETSGSVDNAYAQTTMGDGTAIADDTIMCIYGFSSHTIDTPSAPDITTLRITVGAALRAQLNLYPILVYDAQLAPKKGYLDTPIILTPNQTLKIEEFVTTTSQVYQLAVHGFIAEKAGKVLQA